MNLPPPTPISNVKKKTLLYTATTIAIKIRSELSNAIFFPASKQQVEVTPWISSKHNMGMAFNRSTWHEITRCARHFCEYDDYNWDWSLQHVSQQCLKQKLHVMVVKGPRVFHIGEW